MSEQVTGFWARPVERRAETRYVNGETRYMKIQKPGRAVLETMTLRNKVSRSVLKEETHEEDLPAED